MLHGFQIASQAVISSWIVLAKGLTSFTPHMKAYISANWHSALSQYYPAFKKYQISFVEVKKIVNHVTNTYSSAYAQIHTMHQCYYKMANSANSLPVISQIKHEIKHLNTIVIIIHSSWKWLTVNPRMQFTFYQHSSLGMSEILYQHNIKGRLEYPDYFVTSILGLQSHSWPLQVHDLTQL